MAGVCAWGRLGARLIALAVAAAVAVLPMNTLPAQSVSLPGAPAAAPDWGVVARVLVERMQLARGERVLLVAQPGLADGVVAPLRAAIVGAGAVDLGVLAVRGAAPAGWESDFTRGATDRSAAQLIDDLAAVDVGVMLPGAAPTDAPYAALQRILESAGNRGVRTVHFHWAGAYAMTGELLTTSPAHAALYQRALEQTDYAGLASRQREFEAAMRAGPVRVTTPSGTDITFRIGDRVATRQDGDASAARARLGRTLIDREVELPAGAIRVAPVEESVEGKIAFPDGTWGGAPVQGLVMEFTRGRLTRFTAAAGRDGVERELDAAGNAGRAFREFALGFNPLLAIPTSGERWIPYYGYGAGVVRLSLGDNTELGGNVGGGYVRWNFFTDATVEVGGRTWVRGGVMPR